MAESLSDRGAALEAAFQTMRERRDQWKARADAAEAALATARVEGAREALTRLASYIRGECVRPAIIGVGAQGVEAFRDREYPAPAEPPRHAASCASWECKRKPCDCGYAKGAPTPEPKCVWCGEGNGGGEYGLCAECRATIRDCVRDVLASRPTQTAEG